MFAEVLNHPVDGLTKPAGLLNHPMDGLAKPVHFAKPSNGWFNEACLYC